HMHNRATRLPYTTLFRSPFSSSPQELKVFILGILGSSGFKAVPLASVSNMLKMWAQSGAFAYSKSVSLLSFALLHSLHEEAECRSEEHTSELQSRENLVC